MNEFQVQQLPVVNEGIVEGILVAEDVAHLQHNGRALSTLLPQLRKAVVQEDAHVFDAIKTAAGFQTKIVAVVNDAQQYTGCVTAESSLRAFSQLGNMAESGAIVELQIAQHDYQLSEVARLAEEENIALLSCFANHDRALGIVRLTLKTDAQELSSFLAGLERHGYEISQVHGETPYTEELQERYDALMKYLSV